MSCLGLTRASRHLALGRAVVNSVASRLRDGWHTPRYGLGGIWAQRFADLYDGALQIAIPKSPRGRGGAYAVHHAAA